MNFRKPYASVATKFATFLIEFAQENSNVEAMLNAESGWKDYQNGEYSDIIKQENTPLISSSMRRVSDLDNFENEPSAKMEVEPAKEIEEDE